MKQKLINAEKLKKELTGWETEPTDEAIEYTIDRQPVVDAIPVKWITKWIMKKSRLTGFSGEYVIITEMVEDWEKENE